MPPRTTLALTVAALLLLNIVVSCHREQAERQTPAPPSDETSTERAPCNDPSLCNLSVTAFSDANLTLCGSFPQTPGPLDDCDSGCDPTFDKKLSGFFPENTPREHCIDLSGRLCITNDSATDTVKVEVVFDNSTPAVVDIPPLEKRCFRTNANCTVTGSGCQ
ncbi:MAG: hypothetical protein KF734_11825 [Saprospiraceae bacterium]|nr:hypothetical protein [Saprospiraceae bacterium]